MKKIGKKRQKGLAWLGPAKRDDPVFKEGRTVSIPPQSVQRLPSKPHDEPDEVDESGCKLRDEDSGKETEPSSGGTVIDPEDGLFQAFDQLKRDLGPKEFVRRLMEAFPLGKE